MKGVVCAGGEATRLGELTRITNKHLLPAGAYPMIFYPLKMLELAGVREVMIVTGQRHAGDFIDLLGDGCLATRDGDDQLFDLEITYRVQTAAGGIAQAVGLAHSFIHPDEKFVVVLGDNIIERNIIEPVQQFEKEPHGAAAIVLKEVDDPERFGVPRFDDTGAIVEIIEKPGILAPGPAPSRYAVTGIYMYDSSVFDVIANLQPSARGEYEITDVNNHYVRAGTLKHHFLDGWWRDAGTSTDSLIATADLIQRTGANNT
ncbi:MAG: sugar phosphate nucleotidyltransferase [Actinomycetota bacterium]